MKLIGFFIWLIAVLLVIGNSSTIPLKSKNQEQLDIEPIDEKTFTDNFDTIRTDLGSYIWPTDASTRITSSFAEYRTKHFHGGIDISTNGQTGYKVFAVRDGYVLRVLVTPNGYGKMLFIKHSDGFVSTYAHLKTFNEEINKIVGIEQYKRGTYALDLLLDSAQVVVKQGEVVAYTGDTGFGPPHLHFEIRDENLNPVNPLLSHNFSVSDNISPFIRRIVVIPLSYGSTIDHQGKPKYFSRFPRRNHEPVIPQSIHVHGQIGFGIDVIDRSNGSWGKTGVHKIYVYLDDSLTLSTELNRIPQNDTKQIDLYYDLPILLEGHGKFQKLFIDKGNILPFYSHKPEGSGIINTDNLQEGEHRYHIVAEDISGNQTKLSGTFTANHTPNFEISSVEPNKIAISGDDLNKIDKVYLFGKRSFQTDWSKHSLEKGRFEFHGNEIYLPVNTKPYDVVKIIAITKAGSESKPVFRFIKKPLGPARDIHIQTEVQSDYVLLTLTTPGVFTETPTVKIKEGVYINKLTPQIVDLSRYEIAFIPSADYNDKRTISVEGEVNGKPVSCTTDIMVYSISPKNSGTISYDDSRLIISYDSASVYEQLCFQIKSINEDHRFSYILEPSDVLLNRGIKVSITAPSGTENNSVGLYFRTPNGWAFQGCEQDKQTKSFSTTLSRTLGELALFKDDNPPSFGRLRIASKTGKVFISFRYFDNLSGVDTEEIKMYIDNKLIIPEIDGEHRRVYYQSTEFYKKGKYTLMIRMKDKMKNETELSRIFTVR